MRNHEARAEWAAIDAVAARAPRTREEQAAIAQKQGVLPRSPQEPTSLTLTLPGAPRTKKNHGKIWKAGKRTIIRPSEPWLQWRDSLIRWQLETRFQPVYLGTDGPLNCAALFYRDADRGDACGYYQGLADVLEEIGAVYDDKFITQWDGSRLRLDKANPRVELVLTPVTPSPTTAAGG